MNKRYNLVVPLAGKGQRMVDAGFSTPKPLIVAGDKCIIEWSMDSIDYSECNLFFIVREEHDSLQKFLFQRYPGCTLILSKGNTAGAVDSVLLAKNHISNSTPLIVYCPDVYFEPKYIPSPAHFKQEGFLTVFKANSPNYSYIESNDGLTVRRTEEKRVISDKASVGVYCFSSGSLFVNYSTQYIYEKESYVCPLYNIIIKNGGKVTYKEVDKLYVMGTPEELTFFKDAIFPYTVSPRKFALCCDHSGYVNKYRLRGLMKLKNIDYVDVGANSEINCDYNLYVDDVVKYIKMYKGFGIGFCRTGQGINICANKYPGIRAALVTDLYSAEYAIRHNAANFFSIPNSFTNHFELIDILNTVTFDGGRHQTRMMKNEYR